MKLGILCTMINGFGRRGYYNSQEIGLGRALARKGHEVMIYKGIDPSEKEEKVQVEKNLTIWYLPMKHLGAHGFMDCKYLDPQLKPCSASETSRSSCLMYTDGAGAAAFPLWPMWELPTAWTPILKAR